MIKEIITDQFFLSQKAKPATIADQNIMVDLIDTLKANQERCVGLAANMIGNDKSIIVCLIKNKPEILVNPKITKKYLPYQTTEGCLSLSQTKATTRYRLIEVEYLTKDFKKQIKTFNDFEAQIIQHEIDHCQGILI